MLYEDEFRERSLLDRPALWRLATEVAGTSSHHLIGLPLVLLDVRLESACASEFLASLVAKAPAALAVSLAADEKGRADLGEIFGVAPERTGAPAAATLERLRTALFSTDIQPAPSTDDTLEFFSAPGEGLECVEIARRILRLSAQGFPFDRMAILLRNPERYQPLVEEALRRAGIQAYFSRGSARPDAAGRAFLALLACAAEGCTASRFAEYLSLGQAPADKPEVDWIAAETDEFGDIAVPPPLPDREEKSGLPHFAWEKLLVDAAVVGGRDRWARRLRGLEQEFRLRLAEIDGDEAQTARIERQLDDAARAGAFRPAADRDAAALPDRAKWGEWIERLGEFARSALRNPESVLCVLAELEPMSEVGPATLGRGLRRTLRTIALSAPRAAGAPLWASLRRHHRRGARAHLRRRLSAGARRGSVPTARVRRSAAAGCPPPQFAGNLRCRTTVSPVNACCCTRPRPRHGCGWLSRIRAWTPWKPGRACLRSMRWKSCAPPRDPSRPARFREARRRVRARPPGMARAARCRGGDRRRRVRSGGARTLRECVAGRGQRQRPLPGGGESQPCPFVAHAGAALAELLVRRGRYCRSRSSYQCGPAAYRLSRRAYSPSTLQHFAVCPYRFLLHGVHRLHKRDEPVALEHMDPLTRGSLFHAAQFELFRRIESGEHGAAEIWDLADSVLDRVAADYAEKLAPAIPRVWATEVEDLRMDLRGWIRQLGALLAEWRPILYEFSFGLPLRTGHDPRSTEEEVVVLDGLRLRGSMDIVEKHQTRGVLRITDHKTGKAPQQAPLYVGRGTLLQPLLYALAAEKLFDEQVEAGRLYYCTQRGGYAEHELPLSLTAREQMRKALASIDQAIAGGFLPAAPQQDTCERCDYRPVCGPYEEQRARNKQQDPRLEGLVELRRTP